MLLSAVYNISVTKPPDNKRCYDTKHLPIVLTSSLCALELCHSEQRVSMLSVYRVLRRDSQRSHGDG